MSILDPTFISGALTALIVSVIAGFFVIWISSALRSSPRLTWETLSVSDLEGKLPLLSRYEEDSKNRVFGTDEYKRRLQELSACRYVYALRVLNKGSRAADRVQFLMKDRPALVDTYEKTGVEISEFVDGVCQISLRSVAAYSAVTVVLFGRHGLLYDFSVQHDGKEVPKEPSTGKSKAGRKTAAVNAFSFAFLASVLALLLVLGESRQGGEPSPTSETQGDHLQD